MRPLAVPTPQRDDLLDVSDVLGKRLVETPLAGKVTIREENATAALEVMSRFAIDPHWLIYLPPTMSPTESTSRPGLLEHPDEAFAYYRKHGVERVVCEEKHMGSRAVVVVCRDAEVATRRFGVADSEGAGTIVTRTGRPFFNDETTELALLDRVRGAITQIDLWETLATDWLVRTAAPAWLEFAGLTEHVSRLRSLPPLSAGTDISDALSAVEGARDDAYAHSWISGTGVAHFAAYDAARAQSWPATRAANVLQSRTITQQHAVFSALPGVDRIRPPQKTSIPNLFLAGDWTATGWPATMEGAVRSGYLAAEAVLTQLGQPVKILVDDLPKPRLAKWIFG